MIVDCRFWSVPARRRFGSVSYGSGSDRTQFPRRSSFSPWWRGVFQFWKTRSQEGPFCVCFFNRKSAIGNRQCHGARLRPLLFQSPRIFTTIHESTPKQHERLSCCFAWILGSYVFLRSDNEALST